MDLVIYSILKIRTLRRANHVPAYIVKIANSFLSPPPRKRKYFSRRKLLRGYEAPLKSYSSGSLVREEVARREWPGHLGHVFPDPSGRGRPCYFNPSPEKPEADGGITRSNLLWGGLVIHKNRHLNGMSQILAPIPAFFYEV